MRIQILSAERPFNSRELARLAVGVIATAQAMGLLEGLDLRRLDWASFRKVVERLAAAGIGTELPPVLAAEPGRGEADPALSRLLERLADALEESPAPAHEWQSLEQLFGTERLAELVGVSPASVRRYRAGARTTPDEVAARLHFLATVVGDLAGAYNDFGVRRWFARRRTRLGGKAPAQLLAGDWNPDAAGPRRVRELARSLTAAAAS